MLFKKISVKDIEEFEKKYKGSFRGLGVPRIFFWGGGVIKDIDPDKDWSAHWRMLFKKISVKDIEEFEKKYKGNFRGISKIYGGGGTENFFISR